MPVTPFHMGPGVLFKPLLGSRMSLVVFGYVQVLMDLEVVARIALRSPVLHGFTNTLGGATVIALVGLVTGGPLARWVLRAWNRRLSPAQARWLGVPEQVSGLSVLAGASLGAYSHWFLDAIMHADARPFAPFSDARPLLHLVTVSSLHLWCLATLALGAALLGTVAIARRVRRRGGGLS